jgi:glycosyltransferase involved in cell wall biosynthesis
MQSLRPPESSTGPAPVVTILFLAYQQAQWARASAEACLAQTGGPYEIILSDDHSTDGTFEILQAVAAAYRGPHQVRVRQSPVNVGIGQHYNDLVALARGELLVTMAADDFSVPDRVARQLAAWEASGRQADMIACHVVDMDEDGGLHDVIRVDDLAAWRTLDDWAAKRPYIIGATHAFTKRMMLRFAPLDPEVFYEDQVMAFRAIAGGGAITVDAPLVHYRRGGTSRKPDFEDPGHMRRWATRQRRRERAEMCQLIADAERLGPDASALVSRHLGRNLMRCDYLTRLGEANSRAECWALVRQYHALPWWWRLRKALHHLFPGRTIAIKRALASLQGRR